jgi:hypothetical protein
VLDHVALRRLARKADRDPFFFGHALRRWMKVRGLSPWQAARELGTVRLTMVRLCRRPDTWSDCERIAERFGGDPARYAEVAHIQ